MRRVLTFFAALIGAACSSASSRAVVPTGHGGAGPHGAHGAGGSHHGFADADALAKVFDDPERDAWQRPDDVLSAMDLAPAMTVADVGAGTGYFAVRLARALPQGAVLATDLEPDMVRFLAERARREAIPNLHAVLATQTASGLAARSVDRILVVHVWHHVPDRVALARDLAAALRPGGRLIVVDFSLTAQRGPPAHMRAAPEAVIAELEGAGLSARLFPVTVPDQYLIEARTRP